MADTSDEAILTFLQQLKLYQLKKIWSHFTAQDKTLKKVCGTKDGYLTNILRCFDRKELKQVQIILNDDSELKLVELNPGAKSNFDLQKGTAEVITTQHLKFSAAPPEPSPGTTTIIHNQQEPPSSPRGIEKFDVEEEACPQDLAEISSKVFGPEDLKNAKIRFVDHESARQHLTQFPWLLFDSVDEIPVLPEHYKIIMSSSHKVDQDITSAKVKQIVLNETYEIRDGNWRFEHVLDLEWRNYFDGLVQKFNRHGKVSLTKGAISTIANEFCEVFGRCEGGHYQLHQHPNFGLTNSNGTLVKTKPDLAAGYFGIDTAQAFTLISDPPPEAKKIVAGTTNMLNTILSWETWAPKVANLLLPFLVAEFKPTLNNQSDIIKLFIEMAMSRDMQKRLFDKPLRHTLGLYVREKEWKFYALCDAILPESKAAGFLYKAYPLATFTLEKTLLSWFRLGVIMQRLAAYNLSRFFKCKIISPAQLTMLKEELSPAKETEVEEEEEEKSAAGDANDPKKKKAKCKEKDSSDGKERDDNGEFSSEELAAFDDENRGLESNEENGEFDANDNTEDKSGNNNNGASTKCKLEQSQPSRGSTSSQQGRKRRGGRGEKRRRIDYEADVNSQIYSNGRTDVFIVTANGKEIALKINKQGNPREVYMLRKLQGPGVVLLHHADRSEDGAVKLFLEKLNPLPEFTTQDELRHFIRGLLLALMWIHTNECVHGDIKHSNVMISPTNEIKLIDFESTIELNYGETAKYHHGNTHAYKAPEILEEKPQTNKIDIFSAGLACAEKMFGVRITSFEKRRALIEKVVKGEISHLATQPGIDLLRVMLSKNPEERPTAKACLQLPYFNDDDMDESFYSRI